jgi:hypothetical protein
MWVKQLIYHNLGNFRKNRCVYCSRCLNFVIKKTNRKKLSKITKENPYSANSTHIIGTMPAWLIDDPQEDEELDDKVPELPQRSYMEDTAFVSKLDNELPGQPELPNRSYLEDAAFVSELECELLPHLPAQDSRLPELPERQYMEDGDIKIESNIVNPSKTLSHHSETPVLELYCSETHSSTNHEDIDTEPKSEFLPSSALGRDGAVEQCNESENQYMALSEATRDKEGQSGSSAQYMSLGEIKGGKNPHWQKGKGSSNQKPQDGEQAQPEEGHYMALKFQQVHEHDTPESHYMTLNATTGMGK